MYLFFRFCCINNVPSFFLTNRDKFEKNKDFLKKISKIYRTIAKKKRWNIVDATKSKEEVHKEILKIFSKKLGL
ncbi:MAG: hypothetical protein P8X83_00250 [Nitrosopumilaceae archaeon]